MTYKVIRVLEYVCDDYDQLRNHLSKRGVKGAATNHYIGHDGILIVETTITPIFEVMQKINVPENQGHEPA